MYLRRKLSLRKSRLTQKIACDGVKNWNRWKSQDSEELFSSFDQFEKGSMNLNCAFFYNAEMSSSNGIQVTEKAQLTAIRKSSDYCGPTDSWFSRWLLSSSNLHKMSLNSPRHNGWSDAFFAKVQTSRQADIHYSSNELVKVTITCYFKRCFRNCAVGCNYSKPIRSFVALLILMRF